MMTQKGYLEKGGCCCPLCESDDSEGAQVEIFQGYAEQECHCSDCGAVWTDKYTLTSYEITETCDGRAEDKSYPIVDWQYAVTNGDTRLGYEAWVANQMEINGDNIPY